MEINKLISNDNNETIVYLNERLRYSGLYVAINEDTNESYVGMTKSDLKKRIKSHIYNSHDPEVCKLFNASNTRVHIITYEPIYYEYADLFLYEGITYDEYIKNYRNEIEFSDSLKKIEYEFYRFMQSKGFKMLNKDRAFLSCNKNNYEHGYSENLKYIYENSLKKDNLFCPQVKKFLFPCKEDEKFMNLKIKYLDLQIEFNKMKKKISELEIIKKDLNNQLNEVHLLSDYIQTSGNDLEKINSIINDYENVCEENDALHLKIKQIKTILK